MSSWGRWWSGDIVARRRRHRLSQRTGRGQACGSVSSSEGSSTTVPSCGAGPATPGSRRNFSSSAPISSALGSLAASAASRLRFFIPSTKWS
ncbi:hypothetical protein [Ornithinimicrobium kibberense]|uniref:hypothetical protein n=1 Tax=Ornithinimicrobium kibberense TaxID=282060 RepID=UPI003622BB8C